MFDVWKNVLAEIEQKLSHEAFVTWFDGVQLLGIEDGVVRIGTANVFKMNQIKMRYDKAVREALKHNNIEFSDVKYEVVSTATVKKTEAREVTNGDPDAAYGEKRSPKEGRGTVALSELNKGRKERLATSERSSTGLNPQYSMENFVIGTNNDLAVSVAKNIIANPGGRFNPFFLYGGSGLGKTHLVQAIGNALVKNNPKIKVLYMPTNVFYSGFIDAIRKSKADVFSERFRKLDVLILDDFQMIVGKDASQNAFFDIFNDLHQRNKQIIVTSDRLPDQIKTVDARLANRLAWAGPIDLQMPNFEDKCAILKAKAEYLGRELDDSVIEYLANSVKTNIRELEGELNRLLLYSEVRNIPPEELISNGFLKAQRSQRSSMISPKKIVDKTAKAFGITATELTGKSRVYNIKTARQVAMYLMSEELGLSTTRIAGEVGVKDHTTVMHGVKKIRGDVKKDYALREKIETIRASLFN